LIKVGQRAVGILQEKAKIGAIKIGVGQIFTRRLSRLDLYRNVRFERIGGIGKAIAGGEGQNDQKQEETHWGGSSVEKARMIQGRYLLG